MLVGILVISIICFNLLQIFSYNFKILKNYIFEEFAFKSISILRFTSSVIDPYIKGTTFKS
jgi:hypothetical protein